MVEEFNRYLFLAINATPQSSHELIQLAQFFAKQLILVVPILMIVLWLWQSCQRKMLVDVMITLIIVVSMTTLIRENFIHARPFVEGIGYQFLDHQPTSSFPSNHGTVIFTFAFAFLWWGRAMYGAGLLIAALLIAWSRIYLGVHWPLDMVGAMIVGVIACAITQKISQNWRKLFLMKAEQAYRFLFSIFIRKGWINR